MAATPRLECRQGQVTPLRTFYQPESLIGGDQVPQAAALDGRESEAHVCVLGTVTVIGVTHRVSQEVPPGGSRSREPLGGLGAAWSVFLSSGIGRPHHFPGVVPALNESSRPPHLQ